MDNINKPPESNGRVSFDPGWNDPPTFTYNAQQPTPNKPRLNKRVAFPLSNNGDNLPPAPMKLPPMLSALPPTPILPPPVQKTIYGNTEENMQVDSEKTLNNVKETLLDILNNSTELGTKVESIRKKICAMEDMWTNGKINAQVQLKMQELTQALKDDNPSKADEIHKALMVDHVSIVGTWMPGVKQLIYHCIARTELLAIDKE
ncbi:steroid receptor RNA activator 1-like [Pieris napi]|uniref:steroid receptor RNA activator 1-like n=1 Tax=Pieris napi TaxID=78633 RepID=UPI001FBA40A6|nr:steroid receptor RNA activator 1-like [Pieris napi]